MEVLALEAAETGYLALLRSGPNYRIQVQPALCRLLRYIALAHGREEEEVQNEFEQRAVKRNVVEDWNEWKRP